MRKGGNMLFKKYTTAEKIIEQAKKVDGKYVNQDPDFVEEK